MSASVTLSNFVAVGINTGTGSYSDQSNIDGGNVGVFLTNSQGAFINGNGLLDSGAVTLQAGANTFFFSANDFGGNSDCTNIFFDRQSIAHTDMTAGVGPSGSGFFAPSASFSHAWLSATLATTR